MELGEEDCRFEELLAADLPTDWQVELVRLHLEAVAERVEGVVEEVGPQRDSDAASVVTGEPPPYWWQGLVDPLAIRLRGDVEPLAPLELDTPLRAVAE